MVFTHKIVCRKSPKLYASYHNQTPQKTCFNLTEKAAFNLPNNTHTLPRLLFLLKLQSGIGMPSAPHPCYCHRQYTTSSYLLHPFSVDSEVSLLPPQDGLSTAIGGDVPIPFKQHVSMQNFLPNVSENEACRFWIHPRLIPTGASNTEMRIFHYL